MRQTLDLALAQKLADEGLNAPAIAARLGVSRHAIYLARTRGHLRLSALTHGRPPVIDAARLVAMIAAGKTTKAIAAEFGVQGPAVTRACHRLGLALPNGRRPRARGPRPVPPPQLQAAPQPRIPVTTPRMMALVETGGSYADLAAWAVTWGGSAQQARLEWHRLGLPVQPRRAA
jgi:transposase